LFSDKGWIAARCGFGARDTMRRAFLRVAGVLPEAYRRRYSFAPARSRLLRAAGALDWRSRRRRSRPRPPPRSFE
jgi:AraC-like DNA-binding protein